MSTSGNWFYGGIRSRGRYVLVLDSNKVPRVKYKVKGIPRRKLRKYLRQEYGDALIICPLV